jgi:hypothetical protein
MTAAIAYEDWVQEGTKNSTAAAGNIGLFDNLKSPQLSDCVGAESTVASVPNVVGASGFFSWGDARPVQVVSILDIRSSGDLFFDLYGVGPDVGSFTDEHRYSGFPSGDFVRHLHIFLPTPRMLTGVGLNFGVRGTANGGTGLGSFTIGRLWAGPLWLPPQGIHREWETAIIDPGEVARSRGGQGYARTEQRLRRLSMTLTHVPAAQAFGLADNSVLDLQQLGMRIGTTSPVLVFPRVDDEHLRHRLGIYGNLTEPMRIRHGAGDQFNAGLEVVEQL